MKFGNLKLARVLREHSRYRMPGAKTEALGDSYLLHENEIYRSVRQRMRTRKIPLVAPHDPLAQACGLLGIHSMFESRSVVAQANALPLQLLERGMPGATRMHDLPGIGLLPNAILHESVHMLWFAQEFRSWKHFLTERNKKDFVLRVMLGESLAVACECVAQSLVRPGRDSRMHEFFLDWNLYTFDEGPRPKVLRKLVRKHGIRPTLQLLVHLLLYSNYLYEEIDIETLKKICRDSKSPRISIRTANLFIQRMTPRFRLRTATLYFRSLGFKAPITKLLRADPGLELQESPELRARLESFIRDLG